MGIYNQILRILEDEFHLSTGVYYIPEEKKARLKKVTKILEYCWENQDIESIELTTGTANKALYISLTAEDFVTEHGRNHPLVQLVGLADTVRFSQKSKFIVCMKLQFNDIVENV